MQSARLLCNLPMKMANSLAYRGVFIKVYKYYFGGERGATENTTHARLTFLLSLLPRLPPVGPLVFYYVMLGSHEPQRKRDGKRDLRAKETAVMSHGHRNKQRTLSRYPTCFQPITNSMMSVPISLPLSFPALYTAQSITLILSLAAKIPSSCNLT